MRKLEAELRRYANSDFYPFHMPGHKRRGDEINQIDITEIDGFDNLHNPEGLISGEMDFAASHYGTKTTWFSVNGSTCAILAAISAAVPYGGTLAVERGCHISVYHAAYLRHLRLVYLDESGEPDPESEKPDALVVTSPSYEGCVKNVRKFASAAHLTGVPLIVDEAHGAHFSMHPYFPESAVHQGADLVIQSLHKTLPAMTQTALLHNVTGRVPDENIRRFLDIYETSSPSYVLMASITSCLHLVFDERNDLFERYVSRLKALRSHLSNLRNLRLMGGETAVLASDMEFCPYPAGTSLDPGKITILTGGSGMTAAELYDRLRKDYHLQPEMKAISYVLLMTSVYDTDEGFRRLDEALHEIDGELDARRRKQEVRPYPLSDREERFSSDHQSLQRKGPHLPEASMTIADAMDAPLTSQVSLSEARGRIAADYVIIFPPDAPVIVPGERYDEETIREIERALKNGLTVSGMTDGKVKIVNIQKN